MLDAAWSCERTQITEVQNNSDSKSATVYAISCPTEERVTDSCTIAGKADFILNPGEADIYTGTYHFRTPANWRGGHTFYGVYVDGCARAGCQDRHTGYVDADTAHLIQK